MPFTPFHLGPALMLGVTFGYLDLLTFLLANVIVDFEPFFVLVFDLNLHYGYPLHGFFHTFFGGSIVALILAEVMVMLYSRAGKATCRKKLMITALAGVYLHIILDSFLYTDIRPFFPSNTNPLYGVFSSYEVYGFCIYSFFGAPLLYALKKLIGSEGVT